ncbi:MAG: cobyrinate a,c-diamide synthase [Clostridiales bacterium]|nr:cobyrinate a,c-diamide synthase [Clostridiales bacterium]
MTPRLMFCAPASGSGKTTVTCAVLRALLRRGLMPMACKSGPDYIDPMFHSQVLGTRSCNLDMFFFSRATTRNLLEECSRQADVTILEGAMGYYDGIAMSVDASAYALAEATETPAVLVVDGRGRAISAAAEVQGFQSFRQPSRIAGVILNRVSPMLYPRLAETISRETGLPVMGYLPVMEDCSIESRHLGLVTAAEISDLQQKLDRLAEQAEKTLDLDGLLALAQQAPELETKLPTKVSEAKKVRIAVARDKAFCFYYEASLQILRDMGAELVDFSPLTDSALPENVHGLYLGGGYPELYARQLAENEAMRCSIYRAVSEGLPTIAECGGFMYLHKTLRDGDGMPWPMVGVLDADAFPTGKLSRFGYVTLTAETDSLLFHAGDTMPAHEFHYWDSTEPGQSFTARKPQSARHWKAGIATESLYAGFPHFHFASKPEAAGRFLEKAMLFKEKDGEGVEK